MMQKIAIGAKEVLCDERGAVIAAHLQSFDAGSLKQDLRTLATSKFVAQPGPYHGGGWTGVSLYRRGGEATSAAADSPGLGEYLETEVSQIVPAIRAVMRSIPGRLTCARLMRLGPMSAIAPHNDGWHTAAMGLVRLNMPIISPAGSSCVVAGRTMPWREGELWYVDFSREHWVTNYTQCARVNMVIDVELTESLLAWLPNPTRREWLSCPLAKDNEGYAPSAEERSRFCRRLLLPGEARGLLGHAGRVDVEERSGHLIALIDGKPWTYFRMTSRGRGYLLGTPPAAYFEADGDTILWHDPVPGTPGGRVYSVAVPGD